MATYPVLKTAYKSDPAPLDKIQIDRAEDGTGRGRSFYASSKVAIKPMHPFMTAAERTTLDAFYAVNRLLEFNYACPASGITYVAMFAKPPVYEILPGGWFNGKTEMEQV